MRPHALFLALFATLAPSFALKLPLLKSRQPRSLHSTGYDNLLARDSGDENSAGLSTINDMIYIVNITVGDNDYKVQLDTGSSDLWIKGGTTPLPNSQQTSTAYNLTYGVGWAYGYISYASAEFANVSIAKQAFLDTTSASNPALVYGASGILGLGFTSLSTVDALVNETSASTGRSLLYNLFADNPSEPNFISFSLQSSTDDTDEVQGTFLIGELEEGYASINETEAIPTFPVSSPSRWTILLEALMVGSETLSVATTVLDAPANRAVVLLDSGTSYSYAPTDVCDSIYGNITGAEYDSSLGQWIVPCDAEVDIALQFGGRVFPIHPLDVTPVSLSNSEQCVGSFVPQDVSSIGAGSFDWIFGDNVLRSIYSMYDFGDFDSNGNMGDPYVKLLALVDADKASADFASARGSSAKTNITYNVSNATMAASTTVSLSSDVEETLSKVSLYLPILLAILGLNALVMASLLLVGVLYLCRKKKNSSVRARKNRGRMTPVPLDTLSAIDPDSASSYRMSTATQHVYQPVSMAMTDDTFVPPSPAFHGYPSERPGAKDLKAVERPNSVA